jgi:hypothetical protein
MAPGVFRIVFYQLTVDSNTFDLFHREMVMYPLTLSVF